MLQHLSSPLLCGETCSHGQRAKKWAWSTTPKNGRGHLKRRPTVRDPKWAWSTTPMGVALWWPWGPPGPWLHSWLLWGAPFITVMTRMRRSKRRRTCAPKVHYCACVNHLEWWFFSRAFFPRFQSSWEPMPFFGQDPPQFFLHLITFFCSQGFLLSFRPPDWLVGQMTILTTLGFSNILKNGIIVHF